LFRFQAFSLSHPSVGRKIAVVESLIDSSHGGSDLAFRGRMERSVPNIMEGKSFPRYCARV
jgi:hypothetical protein